MSSNLCPSSCSIPANTFSGTLTGGIQDIAALLPLLGTEECESALTNGYLYAAASPMSLFGSLGIALAGFKAFLAGVNFPIHKWNLNGAEVLSYLGFQPQGTNLSLIMADPDKQGRYVVESRLDKFLEELHLDNTEIHRVRHQTKRWSFLMIAATAFTSSLSMLPYVYLNTGAESNLSPLTRWSFPALRAVGGFLTTTMMPLVIQRRIISILENKLSERHKCRTNDGSDRNQNQTCEGDGRAAGESRDSEKGLEDSGACHNTQY
jgi:hypothetical protein